MDLKRIMAASRSMGAAVVRRKIKYLILHVNSVCNARCRMCFSWRGMQDRHDVRGISLDNLAKLAASLRPLPQLTCSGGEPLLRPDLGEVLHAFHRQADTRFFTVPTNALAPECVDALIDAFVARCSKAYLNFCLPFHGVPGAHDDIMGVPGAFEAMRETYARIQARRKEHPNVSCVLNFVMSQFNHAGYRDTIDLALREFPDAPLGIALCRGATREAGAGQVPVESYQAAQRYRSEHHRSLPGFNPYAVLFNAIGEQTARLVEEVAAGERESLCCGAGRNLAVIYDDGKVYPCEILEGAETPFACAGDTPPASACLGNLNEFGFDIDALLRAPQAREVLGWLDKHSCACTWECAIYSKIVHSPREMASLAREIARQQLGKSARRRKPISGPKDPNIA